MSSDIDMSFMPAGCECAAIDGGAANGAMVRPMVTKAARARLRSRHEFMTQHPIGDGTLEGRPFHIFANRTAGRAGRSRQENTRPFDPSWPQLKEALTVLNVSVDRLARSILTTEAIAQLGRTVTDALTKLRDCSSSARQVASDRPLRNKTVERLLEQRCSANSGGDRVPECATSGWIANLLHQRFLPLGFD
jgi:hypothetical protein